MRNESKTVILLLMSVVLPVNAAVADRVAVVVGTDVITQTEVDEEARVTQFLNREPLDLSPDARKAAAERLINQQLIRGEMSISRFPEPSEKETQDMLRNFRQQHYPNESQFRTALQKYGLTEDDLKAHLQWQLAAMRFTDQRFRSVANAPAPAPETSADRIAPGAPPRSVDEAMDQWLSEARSRTRIEFKKEAFQ